jgi:hypothetical protein
MHGRIVTHLPLALATVASLKVLLCCFLSSAAPFLL